MVMAKDKEREKSRIILINSFKGGAGKTSISLALCVTAAIENHNKKHYNKIFYFDIDLLGTGSYYKLFPDGIENRKYFNDYDKSKWHEFPKELKLEKDGEVKGSFYALYINPILRIKKKIYENTVIRVNDKKEETLIGDIIHFMENETGMVGMGEKQKPNLYILDCSPGFNKFERKLIEELNNNSNYNIKEVFVTSYDSSHVEKTVECLKEYCNTSEERKKFYIVLNDIHNISKKINGVNLNFSLAEKEINNLFNKGEKINDYEETYYLYENTYSERLCASNLFLNKIGIANSFDDYNIINSFYNKVVN